MSDAAYRARHRVLQIILWLQVPALVVVATLNGPDMRGGAGMVHMAGMSRGRLLVWLMIAMVLASAVAAMSVRSRRGGSLVVSVGLLLAAATLVHAGGGLTDLHFGFFIMLGLISLYQDWLPLALSVALVAAHHLVMGLLAPAMLYSDPHARAAPVRFAVLHAGFVLGMCAVQIAYWRFAYASQQENQRIQSEGEQALRRHGERFHALVQDSYDVIHLLDTEWRIESVSAAVQRVMGYQPAGLASTRYLGLIHPDDQVLFHATTDHHGERRIEVRVRHAAGDWHWHEVTVRDLSDHPAVAGIVISHRDITERRTFQERLQYEASHDALTGVANRTELLRILGSALADSAGGGLPRLAVLYIDLDGFKHVNDTYGHETGDGLLTAVAMTLCRCVLGADQVGRLGGDEFAVVLRNITNVEDAVAVARRILAELAQPVTINGAALTVRASIGIALPEPDCLDTDQLLHRADTAMYHAKRDEDAGWRLYVDGIHDPSATATTLEDDLRQAVDADQLRLQYQPIVALGSGDLTGFEALVRWQHPTRGLLPPLEFIPLAEQSQLINDIGHWVLRRACTQVAGWQRRLPSGRRLSVSVNLAPRQLDHPTLTNDVLTVLRDTGLAPGDLVLEVTESALLNDAAAIPQLTALHDHGIRIALDDFGTGYSSLRYLTRLPVDILKLDRCFVAELNGTPQGSAVAEAVIRLGNILHLDTVAEGIEDHAQATEITLLGCHSAQGYHYARPLDPHQVDLLLTPAMTRWPSLPETVIGHLADR